MKELLRIVLVTVATLGLVGVAVGVGHDRMTLVSPPEAVAEQLARQLAGGRYDVARQHFEHDSPALRERVRSASDTLRARGGAISAVEGKAGSIDGDTATAAAVITTARAGDVVMHVALVRRAGSWRIASFQF
jgi:hypothetical protein